MKEEALGLKINSANGSVQPMLWWEVKRIESDYDRMKEENQALKETVDYLRKTLAETVRLNRELEARA